MTGMIARIEAGLRTSEKTYRISPLTSRLIVFFPFMLVFFSLLVMEIPLISALAKLMLSENYPVEWLTFVALFSAGIMGLRLAWRARNNENGVLVVGFYALLSAGLLFAAMEEVSWGQWIFGFEVPSTIKAINKQGELNLHNVPVFHEPFEFLRIVFGLGGLVGVWLSSQRYTRDIGAPAILASWFVLIAILAALDFGNNYIPNPRPLIFRAAAGIVEVLELLIGLSAFLYMWLNGRMLAAEWKEVNA